MDFSLRCNSLKCRAQLDDRAVVTTCSHIFCVPCSESLGLANPNSNARICPACETQLSNPDDAVVTQLNPTEDYKTSVLSGLSPTIIMECAGRALSFYSYQTAQEIVYQEFMAKSLTDKYSTLSSQVDKIIHDANSEIMNLRDKLSAMHLEQQQLEQKNHELGEKFKKKSKSQQQFQRLYQSLKQQQLAAGIEVAAEHSADQALQAAAHGNHRSGRHMQSRGSNGSGRSGEQNRTTQMAQAWEQQVHGGSRAGLQTSRSAPIVGGVPASPSIHRQRMPLYGNNGTTMKQTGGIGGDASRQGTPYRQPLNATDPNVCGNSAGYGMSAGVKMGRQPNGPIGWTGMPLNRPSGLGGLHGR